MSQETKSEFRREHDLIGERDVPAHAYYGIQTLRALENFHITGVAIAHMPDFIHSLAYVKKAAAFANMDLNILSKDLGTAIVKACDEILEGKLHDQFVVDMIQGGAGTSTNMNANEVIANRANELLGHQKGDYDFVHPNNHVNCSQSTNDAYPTAFRITLNPLLTKLEQAMAQLQSAFVKKGEEFSDVIKMGRTQLQDAVPMTLGQEFAAFATTIGEDIQRVKEAKSLVLEINMGATAIGTGINAPPQYAQKVTQHLRKVTGIPVVTSPNLIEATWDTGAYVQISGVLKRVAVKLSKICNDLRLLSSGPRCGLFEINLPKMQPGSSIMPGKVNPVIPEVVNQVTYQVIGNDLTITLAAENGQLELNVMEPVIAYNLFQSIDILTRACQTLREKCVLGITANKDHCRKMVENSIGIVTALNPILGYEKSTEVAKAAFESGRSVRELVFEKGWMTREKLDEYLSIENMVNPKYVP